MEHNENIDNFQQIVGQKITGMYIDPIAEEDGVADTRIFNDFIYALRGTLFLKTEAKLFLIGAICTTPLGTDYLGIKGRNELFENSLNWKPVPKDLISFEDQVVTSVKLYINKEGWPHVLNDEWCVDGLELVFQDHTSLSMISADYEIDATSQDISFVPGRSSLVIFPNIQTFKNCKLDQASEIRVYR